MATKVTKDRFITLKNKVKSEMTRRRLTNYTSSAYDYTISPASGTKISAEHYEKNSVPIMAVNSDYALPTSVKGTKWNEANLTKAENAIQSLSSYGEVYQGAHGCKAACTGLCSTACTTTCGGTCTATCANDCTNTCKGTCSSYCSQNCSSGCREGCGGCSDSCFTSCSGTCDSGCKGCSGSCSGSCSGCSGTCKGSCSGGCSGTCFSKCVEDDFCSNCYQSCKSCGSTTTSFNSSTRYDFISANELVFLDENNNILTLKVDIVKIYS